MATCDVFRDLLPPIVLKLTRRLRAPAAASAPAFTWEGIYPDFHSVPTRGKGHGETDYLEATKRLAREAGETLPPAEHALFPLLATSWHQQQGQVRVLDVGGGAGLCYAHFRRAAPACENVRWHVVEVADVCRTGRELFPADEVTFHEEVPPPDVLGPIDLVQAMSALHYIEDYRGIIARMCAAGAALIYILKEPVGDFPTFATAQHNLGDTVTPAWFFNRRELLDLFAAHGYDLLYHGLHDRVYDTSNFPPERRWCQASHLLFAKKDREGR
jgi:putative methyltransferase (TIGR04325 family)